MPAKTKRNARAARDAVRNKVAEMPLGELVRAAPFYPAHALNPRRDGLIREYVQWFYSDRPLTVAAGDMAQDFRKPPPLGTAKRSHLAAILALNDSRGLCRRRIYDICRYGGSDCSLLQLQNATLSHSPRIPTPSNSNVGAMGCHS
ncbi:MAG: hypothetical protein WDN04_18195 [Rhodospirillales bacterium]